jgi:prepilin-type processing-associated H-X9-DG protein
VCNEAATLDVLLREVVAAPYDKQVIVVDDGSTDGTAAVLGSWESRPGFVLLRHTANRGKGRAIRSALTQAQGRFTIIQDADLEYDPRDYRAVIEPLRSGRADVVLGSRYLNGTPGGVSRACRWGVSGLNVAAWLIYGVRLSDEATCYKAMRTETLRSMALRCEWFEFCPEVVAKACRMGLSILEVPVSYRPRTQAEGKKIRLADGISALSTLWRWRKWIPQPEEAPTAAKSAPPSLIPAAALRSGFSLVELLTVLGIITLLIGLLLPSVVRALNNAERVKCLAALQQIGHAAQLHQSDRGGCLPVAGWHFAFDAGEQGSGDPSNPAPKPKSIATPAGLHDPAEQHHVYYVDGGVKRPAPVTVALALYMGARPGLGSRQELQVTLATEYFKRHFLCPAQALKQMRSGLSQRDDADGWTAPPEFSSYVFNEAVLGMRTSADTGGSPPPVGHSVRIKRPSTVMFAADGHPRNQTSDNWLLVFEKRGNDTLYDFQQRTFTGGWGKDTFDRERHQRMMNVLFLDGHAEGVLMSPGGLKSVGVSRGIYD